MKLPEPPSLLMRRNFAGSPYDGFPGTQLPPCRSRQGVASACCELAAEIAGLDGDVGLVLLAKHLTNDVSLHVDGLLGVGP